MTTMPYHIHTLLVVVIVVIILVILVVILVDVIAADGVRMLARAVQAMRAMRAVVIARGLPVGIVLPTACSLGIPDAWAERLVIPP